MPLMRLIKYLSCKPRVYLKLWFKILMLLFQSIFLYFEDKKYATFECCFSHQNGHIHIYIHMCLCVCMYININTYIFFIFTTTLKRLSRERSRMLPNFTRKGIKPTFGFLLTPFSNSFSSFTVIVFFIFHKILKLYYVRNPGNTSNSLQIREH